MNLIACILQIEHRFLMSHPQRCCPIVHLNLLYCSFCCFYLAFHVYLYFCHFNLCRRSCMSVVVDLFIEFVSRREFYCCATLSTFPSKNTFPRTYIIHKLLFKHVDVSIIDNFSLIFLCLFHYFHNFPFPSHLLGCASWPRSIISKIQCFSLKKKMKIQMKNKAYFLFILKIECFSFMYFLIVQ